jgi:hypothetical protein
MSGGRLIIGRSPALLHASAERAVSLSEELVVEAVCRNG